MYIYIYSAAIALVGSGNRVLEAVQQLSLTHPTDGRDPGSLKPPTPTAGQHLSLAHSVNDWGPGLSKPSTPKAEFSSEQSIERGHGEGYVNRKSSDDTNIIHEDRNIFAFTSVDIVSSDNPFKYQEINVDVCITESDDGVHSKNSTPRKNRTPRNTDDYCRMNVSSHHDRDKLSMILLNEDDDDRRSSFGGSDYYNSLLNQEVILQLKSRNLNDMDYAKYQEVIHQLKSSPTRSYGDEGVIFPPQSPFRHVQDSRGHGRVQGRGQSNSKPHRGSSERLVSGKLQSQSPPRHNLNNYSGMIKIPSPAVRNSQLG